MQNTALVIERTYPAPIAKVWEAITTPEQMRQWYFPMMEDFKPEPGFETTFDVPVGENHYLHMWKVSEVIPGRKISYEWRFDGFPGNSLVSFELFEEKDGTRLVLTHEKLETFRPDENPELAKGNFMQGWTQLLAGLKAWLEREIQLNPVADRFPKKP